MCPRSLHVEQLALEVASDVYRLTEAVPSRERFGLAKELRRSAISIGSNIAEGRGRRTGSEFGRFVDIALGSARELEFQYELARRVDLLRGADVETLAQRIDELVARLMRQRSHLRNARPEEP